MKCIFMMMVFLVSSSAFASDAVEIYNLKLRISRLETMVKYLIRQQRSQSGCQGAHVVPNQAIVIPTVPTIRQQFIVTLYDNTTFLIYKWDRNIVYYTDPRNNRRYSKKKYTMYDVFGKKRVWPCDKVRSILKVEKSNAR